MTSNSGYLKIAAAAVCLALACPALAEEGAKSCATPTQVSGGPSNAHTRFLEANIWPAVVQAGARPATLAERMRAYDIPGVSVAVIHGGELAWARGWGVRDTASCKPVNPETVFQSASISKLASAMVALRLVEQGKLALDAPIDGYLRSWHLGPDRKLAPDGVTLRQLLSHTAGLNVHGFPGYLPGAALPTPAQVLAGAAPANTEAVRNVLPVGRQWQYSGGGYVIAQQAMLDVTRTPFSELARRELLGPLGMSHSDYTQPPSAALLANAALGHSSSLVIPGGYHVYPELAAAGLWTTAGDLARLLIDVQEAAAGKQGRRLSRAMARTMLTPVKGDWGLGPALSGAGPARRFGHDGVNEGFQATMVAYVEKGEGVVVLTNGDKGRRLADEIVRAVAMDYGWAELASPPAVEIALSAPEIARVAGAYEGGGLVVFIESRDGGLFAQTGGPRPERLVPLSPVRFRSDASGILVEFTPDFSGFRILENGPPLSFVRSATKASIPADLPIFLRGSMNDWNISAPLARQTDGSLAADIQLEAGDHQLKFASADWATDYGAPAGESARLDGKPLALVLHGGNIHLSIERAGLFHVTLRAGADRKGEMTIVPRDR